MGQTDNTSLCTNHQKNVYFKKKLLYSFSMIFFIYIQLILNTKVLEKQRVKNKIIFLG